jgi:hypothetical protein
MTVLSQRTIVGLSASIWDDSQFVPDAIVLNLETNVSATSGFIGVYTDFLVNLTQKWSRPDLPIFCGAGPIILDHAPWVQTAMATAAQRGLSSLHFFNSTTELDGCGHPG